MQAEKNHTRHRAPLRTAFTLIEMLVVISVVVALSAMTIPIVNLIKERGKITQTRATVEGMAAAIAAAGTRSVTVLVNGKLRTYRRFDVNNDGELDLDIQHCFADDDGMFDPGIAPDEGGLGGLSSDAVAALFEQGYRGPVVELQPSIPKEAIDDRGQVLDAWGKPLRVAKLTMKGNDGEDRLAELPARGADAIALWSAGPDGVDDTEDDIRSWETE